MTKLNIFLILLLAGMLTFVKIQSATAMDSSTTSSVTPTLTPTTLPTPTPIPVGVPVSIQIPKIQEDGPVVPTGVDSQGKMLMPESWTENGWYSGPGSAKPGESGNAVIAGHLDTIFGTKGHFFLLSQVVPGDPVTVRDSFGREYHFQVVDKQTYEYDKVPLDAVFGPTTEKHLNLITCTGWYNIAQHNYSHRLVVYTKLVE